MVTLYTTHCPMCQMLESKLKEKQITYATITDKNIMLKKGFTSVPMLEINNQILNTVEAMKFVNEYQKGNN